MTLTELEVLASVRTGLDHVGRRLMLELLESPIHERIRLCGRLHWLGTRISDLIEHEQSRRLKKEHL